MVKQVEQLQKKIDKIVNRLLREKILRGSWLYDSYSNDCMAEALMHPSALEGDPDSGLPEYSYENLEWYGDKVISLILRSAVLKFFSSSDIHYFNSGNRDNPAGKFYNHQKSNAYLEQVAQRFELDKALCLGKSQTELSEKMRADVVEASIGALMFSKANISWAALLGAFFPEFFEKFERYNTKFMEPSSEDEEYLFYNLMGAIIFKGPKAKEYREAAFSSSPYYSRSYSPNNINYTSEGRTLLSEAVTFGHMDLAKRLLERGADALQAQLILTGRNDKEALLRWNNFVDEQVRSRSHNSFLQADSPLKAVLLDLTDDIRAAVLGKSSNRNLKQDQLYILGFEVFQWAVADALMTSWNHEFDPKDLNTLASRLINTSDVCLLIPHMKVVENLAKGLSCNPSSPHVDDILVVLGACFLSTKWDITRKSQGFTLGSDPEADRLRHKFIRDLVVEALKPRIEAEVERLREEKILEQKRLEAEAQKKAEVARKEKEAAELAARRARQQQQAKLLNVGSSSNFNACPASNSSEVSDDEEPAKNLFFRAAAAKNRQKAEELITQALRQGNKPDIDFCAGRRGFTPLLHAIKLKKAENALALLEAGANPSKPNPKTHKTPLELAKEKGLISVVQRITSPR